MTGIINRVSRIFMYASMVIIMLMTLHVAGSVALRWVTGRDIPLTLEVTAAYYMVALTFFPLALIDLGQKHIRAEFFYAMTPPRVQYGISIVIRVAMIAYLALLTWRTFLNAIKRTEARESMITIMGHLPTWPARWIVPLGLFLATCAGVLLLVRAIQNRDDEVTELVASDTPSREFY